MNKKKEIAVIDNSKVEKFNKPGSFILDKDGNYLPNDKDKATKERELKK
jgi:hypothetical protein